VPGNLVITVLDEEGDTVRSMVELEAMDGFAVLVGANAAGAGFCLLYLHLLMLMKPRLKYTFGFQVISVRFLPGLGEGRQCFFRQASLSGCAPSQKAGVCLTISPSRM